MTKLLDQFGHALSDSYTTPLWLTAILPEVSLDPASNPRSTVRAKRTYSLEKKMDGLKLPWTGSVFVNWPYGDPLPWARKLIEEINAGRCTEAIVLAKLDSSTQWFQTLISVKPVELWTFDRRIQFGEPPELVAERVEKYRAAGKTGGEKSSNNFCSAIIHYRGSGYGVLSPALQLEAVASRWQHV